MGILGAQHTLSSRHGMLLRLKINPSWNSTGGRSISLSHSPIVPSKWFIHPITPLSIFQQLGLLSNCLKFYMINSPGKNVPTSDSSNSHESHQIIFLPGLNTSLPAWMFYSSIIYIYIYAPVILVAKTSSLGLNLQWVEIKITARGTVLLH